MLFVIGKSENYIGTVGGIICGMQRIPLIGSIFQTEIALKRILIKAGIDDNFRFV